MFIFVCTFMCVTLTCMNIIIYIYIYIYIYLFRSLSIYIYLTSRYTCTLCSCISPITCCQLQSILCFIISAATYSSHINKAIKGNKIDLAWMNSELYLSNKNGHLKNVALMHLERKLVAWKQLPCPSKSANDRNLF